VRDLLEGKDLEKLKSLDPEQQTEFISRFGLGAKRQILKLIARREKIEKILEMLEAYEIKLNAADEKAKPRIQKEINIFIKYLEKYNRAEK